RMLNVLLTGSVSFALAFLAIPAIMKVAREKKLYDLPDERKVHANAIASLGGVGIFIGFLLSALLTILFGSNPEFPYFFAAAIVILSPALKDDYLIISAIRKFLCKLAAASSLIPFAGIRIDSIHGFLGIDELPDVVAYLISYVTIMVIT